MKITSIRTHAVVPYTDTIYEILEQYLPDQLEEKSVLAISSKIISICEGSVVPQKEVLDKDQLIIQESERYLPRSNTPGGYVLHTYRNNMIIPSAGVDASNAGDYFVLLPKNVKQTAFEIYQWVIAKYGLVDFGVVITDSHTTPFRKGVTGYSLGHFGFASLRRYQGSKDLFNRTLKISQVNIPDSLAAGAVFSMGEGAESTPLAIIQNVSHVLFGANEPQEELEVPLKKDVYAPFFTSVPWRQGGKKS